MNKKLCVIMSLYKNDKLEYLQLAVESVLNQTFIDFDYFIQFDGVVSEECSNYLNFINDDRIIINKRIVNRGLAVSLNELLHIVLPLGYTYIARMDADDICEPERFEKQIFYLDSNNEYDLVGCNALLINENSRVIGKKEVKSRFVFLDLIKKNELIHSSVLFRNEFFNKVGFYDDSLIQGQDYDLWLRAGHKEIKMCNLSDNLIQFRYDTELIARRKNGQKYEIKIKKKYLEGRKLWIAILPNILIIVLPNFILKLLLKIKIEKYGVI
jgi:glycosyltransferase involved in cell wall biosynthesis